MDNSDSNLLNFDHSDNQSDLAAQTKARSSLGASKRQKRGIADQHRGGFDDSNISEPRPSKSVAEAAEVPSNGRSFRYDTLIDGNREEL
jgi:hypothetical protein